MIIETKSNAEHIAVLAYCESTDEYIVDIYKETSLCSLCLVGTRAFENKEDAEIAYGEIL